MRTIISLLTMLVGTTAHGQTTNPLVGCWNIESIVFVRGEVRNEPFGPKPVGRLIFTADGHFLSVQMKADLSETFQQTPTDRPIIATFGTYNLDNKTLIVVTPGSSRPDWRNQTRQSTIESVDNKELVFINIPQAGTSVRVVCKRC